MNSLRHSRKLIQTVRCDERGLLFIFFCHRNLVVSAEEVDTGKPFRSSQSVEDVINTEVGKRLFYSRY